MELLSDEMLEVLADVQHEMWSSWMKYLFSISDFNEDGTVTIPAALVLRWLKQTITEYCDLSESEKDSDRNEAEKVLAYLAEHNIECWSHWA